MTTVGAIGIGLLILILTWIIALGIFVLSVKYQNKVGWIALGTATAITIILISIPLEKPYQEDKDIVVEKDYIIITKGIILSFVTISFIVGLASFFILHCIEPIRPKPVKQFYVTS